MNYSFDEVILEVEKKIILEFGVGPHAVIVKKGPNALIKVYSRNICLGYTSVYAVSDGTFLIGRETNGCFNSTLPDSVGELLSDDFKELETKVNKKD